MHDEYLHRDGSALDKDAGLCSSVSANHWPKRPKCFGSKLNTCIVTKREGRMAVLKINVFSVLEGRGF